MPYLGSEQFRDWAYMQRQGDDNEVSRRESRYFRPGINSVIAAVATTFNAPPKSITNTRRGRVEDNIPRWIVMHLAQEKCGLTLREITKVMDLKRTRSIPTTIAKLKIRIKDDDQLRKAIRKLKQLI